MSRADAFVAIEDDRLALLLRHGDGHDLVVELPGRPGSRGALLAAGCVFVRVLARDAVFLRKVLGRLDHAGDAAKARFGLRTFAPAIEPVVQFDRARRAPQRMSVV